VRTWPWAAANPIRQPRARKGAIQRRRDDMAGIPSKRRKFRKTASNLARPPRGASWRASRPSHSRVPAAGRGARGHRAPARGAASLPL